MSRAFTLTLAIFALGLMGAGCFERQLETMSAEEIEAEMQAMLVKNPASEFTQDERRTEAQTVRKIEAEGQAERFASFESSSKKVTGSIRIIKQDARYFLTFSELFSIDAGPELYVFLSGASEMEVGPLRSITGGQSYELPTDFDPAKYTSVVIKSKPFQFVFATASF